MAEGSETPGGGLGPERPAGASGPEGAAGRGESDRLAERRARRAAGSGEQMIERRAEAAEATVRTLQAHVASLQQRLREADEERARMGALIEAERTSFGGPGGARERAPTSEQPPPAGAIEHELRLLRQSEFAERRQRLEAEDRVAAIERESGADLERLRRRLSDSESEAGMLAGRLDQLRRELAEAEQTLAAERTALQRAEAELQVRLAELERRSAAAERELDSERAARERAERELERVRSGHRKLEALVAELKAAGKRLREVAVEDPGAGTGAERAQEPAAMRAAAGAPPVAARPAMPQLTGTRAREAPSAGERGPGEGERRGADLPTGAVVAGARNGEMVDALAAAVERLRARVAESAAAAPPVWPGAPRHKHSMSLIGRVRMARKQRRRR